MAHLTNSAGHIPWLACAAKSHVGRHQTFLEPMWATTTGGSIFVTQTETLMMLDILLDQ